MLSYHPSSQRRGVAPSARSAPGVSASVSPTALLSLLRNTKALPTGCIVWTAPTSRRGYPVLSIGQGKRVQAAALVWFLTRGEWPTRLVHTCRERRCVAPACMKVKQ